MKQRIQEALELNLKCDEVEVVNKSHLHLGHLGDDGSGETHFKVIIKSLELKKMSKIQSHRIINSLLKNEFKNGLHAFEIEVL